MSGDVSSIYIYNGEDGVPEDVTHVRVDSSVTIIPEEAFKTCRQLEQVDLPEGLISIGDNAFRDCTSLKMVQFPSTIEKIAYSAFNNCKKLDGIILPDGLQTLEMYAFSSCTSLQRINIPPGISKITQGGFLFCHSLTHVMFSEGITEIENAFGFCKSLESVTLPSSLKVIGRETFQCCNRLNEVHMLDAIESIGPRAFLGCNLINFRLPPLIVDVDLAIFGNLNGNTNKCLIALELSENITRITIISGHSQPGLESLRNIALPSECEVDADAFHNCKDLRVAFPNEDMDTISQALQHRFDDLPVHKICYYQSYHVNETTMQSLRREIKPWTSKPPGRLNTTGKQQDCLGMTPLHILACSTNPTIEMYRLLIDNYPETLIMKDKWGDITLLYAFWCNAPTEVLGLLVESHKTLHLNYEFEWKDMLLTMVKRNVPLANIQRLITTQQKSFPDQEYDMQQGRIDLENSIKSYLCKPYTSVYIVQYLLRDSITKRLDSLAVRRWRVELEGRINSLPKNPKYGKREASARKLYERLATYD